MEEHRRTWFDDAGIVVSGGEPRPLRSGSLHYWRLDPKDWGAALAAMVDTGFNAVCTYVPWSVHELAKDRYDWSGPRDVGSFLARAAEAGLMALIRPGPHINAELTLFGIPERILATEECQARTAAGTPAWLPAPPRMFPVPSYASSLFIDEVRGWFAEVGRALDAQLAPSGPVVALQLDNEMAMFFRTAAFDLDYHPDALAWWRELHGDLEPPRAWASDDAAAGARWVKFKEQYAARSMAWLAEAANDAGLGHIARFHNGPPIAPVGLAPVAVGEGAASMPAWDCYQTLRSARRVREIGLYLSGSTALPFVAELGVGGPAYLPPPEPDAQASAAITLLGSGVRAFNLYMAIDRDRWIDAAIAGDGSDRSGWVTRFLAGLEAIGDARPRPLVALVESRADHRYAVASSVIDPMPGLIAELIDLGPGGVAELGTDPGARAQARARRAMADALEEFEIPWALVDQDAGVATLERFELVVCATNRRIDVKLWDTLRAVAAAGTRVVIGPDIPEVDEFERPLDEPGLVANMGQLGADSFDEIDELGSGLTSALADLPELWIAPEDPEVVCAPLFRGGELAALVVINGSGREVTAKIASAADRAFTDAIDGELAVARGELLELTLGPHRARLLLPNRMSEASSNGALEDSPPV